MLSGDAALAGPELLGRPCSRMRGSLRQSPDMAIMPWEISVRTTSRGTCCSTGVHSSRWVGVRLSPPPSTTRFFRPSRHRIMHDRWRAGSTGAKTQPLRQCQERAIFECGALRARALDCVGWLERPRWTLRLRDGFFTLRPMDITFLAWE